MARYTAILCGGDFREAVEPNNTCPNRDKHTYGPAGYVDWFEWAAKQNQSKCPGCDRYLICTPKRLASAPPALPDVADSADPRPQG